MLLLCLVVVAIQAVETETEENTFQFFFENMLPDVNACGSNVKYETVLSAAISYILNPTDTRLELRLY